MRGRRRSRRRVLFSPPGGEPVQGRLRVHRRGLRPTGPSNANAPAAGAAGAMRVRSAVDQPLQIATTWKFVFSAGGIVDAS